MTGVELWLDSVLDVHTRLLREPPARLAWIGCDDADQLVRVARAYPRISVYASSEDPATPGRAAAAAHAGRVHDRVLVRRADWVGRGLDGRIDVAVMPGPVDDATWPAVAQALLPLLGAQGLALVRTTGFRPAVEPPVPGVIGSPPLPHLRPAEPLPASLTRGLWLLRRG